MTPKQNFFDGRILSMDIVNININYGFNIDKRCFHHKICGKIVINFFIKLKSNA